MYIWYMDLEIYFNKMLLSLFSEKDGGLQQWKCLKIDHKVSLWVWQFDRKIEGEDNEIIKSINQKSIIKGFNPLTVLKQ